MSKKRLLATEDVQLAIGFAIGVILTGLVLALPLYQAYNQLDYYEEMFRQQTDYESTIPVWSFQLLFDGQPLINATVGAAIDGPNGMYSLSLQTDGRGIVLIDNPGFDLPYWFPSYVTVRYFYFNNSGLVYEGFLKDNSSVVTMVRR